MHKLIVHKKASDEIEEIVDYYKTINFDLSICFIDELEKIFNSISVFPESFELVSDKIRRANMGRFPFSIYYNFNNDLIKVLVIRHFRRKTYHGKNRI